MSPNAASAGSGTSGRSGDGPTLQFRALPLRLVIGGRFGLEPNRLHRLDTDGVAGLLDRTAPSLSIRVADRLRADGTELSARFAFRHRRDFAPAAVIRAMPDLARAIAARDALRSGVAPGALSDLPAVQRAVETRTAGGSPAPAAAGRPVDRPAAPADPSGDDAIDRLLGLVDTPDAPNGAAIDPPADPARQALSGFIAEVTRGSKRPTARPETTPSDLDAILGDQIAAVLDHPEFRSLERAWGALRFLVRRIDRQARVTIDVLEADTGAMADALEATVPEDDADPAGPVRIVIDLSDYDASDRDLTQLRRLAAFGAGRRAVVLANAGADFAGASGASALAAMHDPETRFSEDRYAGWRSLRDDPDTNWLGLCLSRLLLRDAHDGRADKALSFSAARPIGRPLDVGVAPAVAELMVAAAAQTDWPSSVGTASDAVVENLVLPTHPSPDFDVPVHPALSVNAAVSIAEAGLITLVAERGRDLARLLRLPSVRGAPNRAATLPAALFQAQIVHGMQWNADRLFTAAPASVVRDRVQAYLGAVIRDTGPGSGADVSLETDDDGLTVLAIQVRSGARTAPGASVAFDVPIDDDAAERNRDA